VGTAKSNGRGGRPCGGAGKVPLVPRLEMMETLLHVVDHQPHLQRRAEVGHAAAVGMCGKHS